MLSMQFPRINRSTFLKIIAIVIPIVICVWGGIAILKSKTSKTEDVTKINTNATVQESSNEEQTGETPTEEVLVSTPNAEQETLTSDDKTASQMIADYLNDTGIYKVIKKSESQWEKTDLSEFAEQDQRAMNLYRYYSFGRYAKDYEDENGKQHHMGDYAEFYCYVTKDENDKYYVHYISKMGTIIFDDGYMTEDLLKIVNRDTLEESGADEQQSYEE